MSFLGQEAQLREFQDRFKFFHVALFIGIGLIIARLVYLQILNGDKMRRYSEENRVKRVHIAAPRGMIFDRNRTLLVDNRPAFDLEIIPQYLKSSGKKDEVLSRLSEIIHVPLEKIQARLKKFRYQPSFLPIKIKTDLTRDEVAKVETWKLDMPGVAVKMEIQRTNVYGDIASHQLGYIGKVNARELKSLRAKGYSRGDSIGRAGIEKRYEATLRGKDGYELVEVDALGRRIRKDSQGRVLDEAPEKSATPGNNLILTVDQDLQRVAAQAFGDKAGGLVALDPKTGEILAMISRPSFDPTEFSRGISSETWKKLTSNPRRPLRDKTIQDHYSPGSIFKIVTAIAALEDGVINSKTKFNCKGVIKVGRRAYHCHKRGGHGDVNVVSALEKSCDVFFFRVAQKLKSVDQIAKWAYKMGFGDRTGIKLAAEVPGLIPTEGWKLKRYKEPWNPGESLSVAIGQSFVLSTALQNANAYAAVANGGVLYKPFIVKAIESPNGQRLETYESRTIKKVEISEKTWDLIGRGLWRVVNRPGGTAYWQRLPGMNMAGKTGTVQVIRLAAEDLWKKCSEMKYEHRHNAIFTAYAPHYDPRIVVSVIAEHECSGSAGAAPIVKEVVKAYLQKYLPEKYSDKALASDIKKDQKQMLAYIRSRKEARENRNRPKRSTSASPAQTPQIPQVQRQTTEESNPGGTVHDIHEYGE